MSLMSPILIHYLETDKKIDDKALKGVTLNIHTNYCLGKLDKESVATNTTKTK